VVVVVLLLSAQGAGQRDLAESSAPAAAAQCKLFLCLIS